MILLSSVVVLAVVGAIVRLLNTNILDATSMKGLVIVAGLAPMSAMKGLLNVAMCLAVSVWLLHAFGVIGPVSGVHIPNLR
jgi:hypothetical protein